VNVKGTSLVSTVRYIQETHGQTGLKQVFAGLSPAERDLAEAGFLTSSWYPLDLLMKLTLLGKEQFGPKLPKALGKASADYALSRVYKIFFRVGSPQFIISRATAVYKNYYERGEMKAVVAEKGHAVVELSGIPSQAPEFCERLIGWQERMLELSGAKDVKVVHDLCLGRGDAVCRFEGWWA
jgi:hypothetical protein